MNQECNRDIHNQTNKRIYERNIPSHKLQPYLNVRPVLTKYSILPIVDPRRKLNVSMEQLPTYNSNITFNPGNNKGPWSGFSSNINLESELRNQFFALQKSNQAVYVPSSTSDLYQNKINIKQEENPFKLLFKEEIFENFNPNEENVGKQLFLNNTRMQYKDNSQKSICN